MRRRRRGGRGGAAPPRRVGRWDEAERAPGPHSDLWLAGSLAAGLPAAGAFLIGAHASGGWIGVLVVAAVLGGGAALARAELVEHLRAARAATFFSALALLAGALVFLAAQLTPGGE